MNADKIAQFEKAFSGDTSGSTRECACGKFYYNPDGSWDWDEGELERLEATGIVSEYAIGNVFIDGVEYCDCCDCWHEKALLVMAFIDNNVYAITRYITAERARLERMAQSYPKI